MRMWMVDTKELCDTHLRGEHVETHMIVGILKKEMNIGGYIDNNLIELTSLKKRHDELAKEMIERGMNHKSEIEVPDYGYLPDEHINYIIDRKSSEEELQRRCDKCFNR